MHFNTHRAPFQAVALAASDWIARTKHSSGQRFCTFGPAAIPASPASTVCDSFV